MLNKLLLPLMIFVLGWSGYLKAEVCSEPDLNPKCEKPTGIEFPISKEQPIENENLTVEELEVLENFKFGRDEVGNGGGLYENRVALIWQSIPNYINKALGTDQFTEYELEILRRIKHNWDEIYFETKIMFTIQNKDFFLDGEYRLAITGDNLSSPIIFNIDLLYEIELEKLNFTLLSFLIHELGHKVGELDHFVLDILGNKVALSLREKLKIYRLSFNNRDEFIEVYTDHDRETSDQIYYTKGNKSFYVNDGLPQAETCKKNFEAHNFYRDKSGAEFIGTLVFYCPDHTQVVNIVGRFDNKGIQGQNLSLEIEF